MPSRVYYRSEKTGPRPEPETLTAQAAEHADTARQAVSGALTEIAGVLELAVDSQDPAKIDRIMSKVLPAVEQAQEAASYSAAAARSAATTKSDAAKGSSDILDPVYTKGRMENAIAAAQMAVEYAGDSKE